MTYPKEKSDAPAEELPDDDLAEVAGGVTQSPQGGTTADPRVRPNARPNPLISSFPS